MDIEYESLVGLPFVAGKQDCFTLTRDFFRINFGIDIPNFSRPTDWDADRLNLIPKLYPLAGFEKVDTWDLRPGDVLATAIGSSNPNHFVVYVGDNLLLQHKYMQLSSTETFRPAWKMVTCFVLRHPDVPDLTPVYPDISLEDLLRKRYESLGQETQEG